MDVTKAQEQIAKLELESEQAQKRFEGFIKSLPTGEATIDEACTAFRDQGNLQLDIMELRLRVMGDAIQKVGIHGLANLDFKFPMIG